jgi:integrase
MATLKLTTEKALTALPPPPAGVVRTYHWDTELKGFGVVVGRTRRTFVALRWVGGKRRKITIGVAGYPMEDGRPWTVMLARRRAAQLLGQMAVGIDPGADARALREGPTLRTGLELHVGNMRKKHRSERSIKTIETEVPKYLAEWMDRPMVEMKGADLVTVHSELTEAGKEFLANRVVAHVSAIFNALDKVHELVGRNPARAVTRNRYEPKRERVEDIMPLPAWWAKVQTLSSVRRDFQTFVLFTGMRSEAARRVRWEHVDLKRKALRVPKPKGGEARAFELPLGKTALEVLKRRRAENPRECALLDLPNDGGWVFPSSSRARSEDGSFKVQPMAEAKERRVDEETGERVKFLPGPHTLRRTYLSVAAEEGISELDRHVLANHAFGRQTVNATYISQAFEHLAECQATIDAALSKRIKQNPQKPARARR